jgi:hypothetical protein
MDHAVSFLKDWALQFLKNKDLILRKIVEIDEAGDTPDFKITFKDRVCFYHCTEELGDVDLNVVDPEKPTGIFLFHTKKNTDSLLENWKKICSYPLLTLYFINPFKEIDNKWIIQPHHHAKIADSASFKTGMTSMIGMVEQVREQDLKRLPHL